MKNGSPRAFRFVHMKIANPTVLQIISDKQKGNTITLLKNPTTETDLLKYIMKDDDSK